MDRLPATGGQVGIGAACAVLIPSIGLQLRNRNGMMGEPPHRKPCSLTMPTTARTRRWVPCVYERKDRPLICTGPIEDCRWLQPHMRPVGGSKWGVRWLLFTTHAP